MTEHEEKPANDLLEALLESSAPHLDEPADLALEIRSMQRDIAVDARPARPLNGRSISAGIALGLAFGGVGLAAASTLGVWEWEDSDLAITFVRPDGVSCDMRYGMMSTGDLSNPSGPVDSSRLDPGMADWLRTTDVFASADVDQALDQIHSGEVSLQKHQLNADGSIVKMGVESFSASELFTSAVKIAVGDVINAEVQARGLPGVAYATEIRCSDDDVER